MKMTNGIFKKIIFVLFFVVLPFTYTHAQNSGALSNEETNQVAELFAESDVNRYLELSTQIGSYKAYVKGTTIDTNSASHKHFEELQAEKSEIERRLQRDDPNYYSTVQLGKKAELEEIKSVLDSRPTPNDAQKKYLEETNSELKNIDAAIAAAKDTDLQANDRQAILRAEAEEAANNMSEVSCGMNVLSSAFWECFVAKTAYVLLYKFSESVLKLSGRLFDFIINYTIVDLSKNLSGGTVLETSWVIFRDIANLLFIFFLIYISIRTILKGTGETGKSIGTVIVVAILINFSLFFTKIIIDVSNTAAISFHNSIVKQIDNKNIDKSQDSVQKFLLGDQKTIAEAFVSQAGVGSMFNMPKEKLNYLNVTKQLVLISIVFIVLAVVLFLATFLLLTRYIILIIVMLASSLAFGAYVLPKFRSMISDKWWSALIGQAFVAPVFMLFLYVSLIVLKTAPAGSLEGNGWGDLDTVPEHIALKLFLVISLLIASVRVSKSLSDQAGGMAGTITKTLGGLALGGVGLLGRNVGGRIANKIAGSMNPTSALGGFAKRRLEGISNSSFDVRNSRLGGSVIKQSGLDMGKPAKDASFTAESAKRAANAKKRAESISNEVDASDPQKRTHREIYESSAMRIATGGGARRRQVIDKRETGEKLEKAKADHKALLSVATDPRGVSYSTHKNEAKRAETELAALKGALAIAIGGGTGNPATIRTDIQRQETILANSQAGMEAIEKSAGMKESFQKVANLQAKYDNIGKGKETTQEDISRQLERLIENSRK